MMGCVLGAGRLIGAPWGGWVRSGQPAALGGSSRRFCERGAGGGRSGPRVEATCFKSPKCGETRCGDLGGVPAACCGGVASLRRCYGAVAELGEFLFWGRSEGASGAELSKTGFQLDNSRLSCIFLNCFCWVGGDHRPTIHHAKNWLFTIKTNQSIGFNSGMLISPTGVVDGSRPLLAPLKPRNHHNAPHPDVHHLAIGAFHLSQAHDRADAPVALRQIGRCSRWERQCRGTVAEWVHSGRSLSIVPVSFLCSTCYLLSQQSYCARQSSTKENTYYIIVSRSNPWLYAFFFLGGWIQDTSSPNRSHFSPATRSQLGDESNVLDLPILPIRTGWTYRRRLRPSRRRAPFGEHLDCGRSEFFDAQFGNRPFFPEVLGTECMLT